MRCVGSEYIGDGYSTEMKAVSRHDKYKRHCKYVRNDKLCLGLFLGMYACDTKRLTHPLPISLHGFRQGDLEYIRPVAAKGPARAKQDGTAGIYTKPLQYP